MSWRSVRDPDCLSECGWVVEHLEHGVGHVGAGDRVAAWHVGAHAGPVPAGQWLVVELWWPHDRPVGGAVGDLVFHGGQVGVDLPREGADQRQDVAGVAVEATGPSWRPRGPTAEMAAWLPSRVGGSTWGSVRPGTVMISSAGWCRLRRVGSRTTAVTLWPVSSACRTRCSPMRPVAP